MDKIELKDVSEQDFKASVEKGVSLTDDILNELEVSVTALVGHRTIKVSELNALKKGEVLSLDTLINEPVQLLYKDNVFALGELVTDGEKIGIKVTDIK